MSTGVIPSSGPKPCLRQWLGRAVHADGQDISYIWDLFDLTDDCKVRTALLPLARC